MKLTQPFKWSKPRIVNFPNLAIFRQVKFGFQAVRAELVLSGFWLCAQDKLW